MRKRILFTVCLMLALMASCSNNKGDSLFVPSVGGNAYDLMIVGNKTIWDGPTGRCLFDLFDQEMDGLPQSEPLFTILFLETHNFTNIVHPMRNLLFYHIDSTQYTQGKVSFSRDRWANTQAIVKVTAPNQEEAIRVIKESGQQIIDFYVDMECERGILYFSKYRNDKGINIVKDEIGVKLAIPNFINKIKRGEKFVWLSNGSLDVRQDIFVYRTPYKDSTDFSLNRIIEKRDSITKIYIEGPSEGSYMTTETSVIPPVARQFYYNKKKCVEVRGLWRTEGDFMGGPFVSRTFLDKTNNEIITVEAFVYAPQHKKRNKIRQTEAVLHSLEFD